MSYRPCPETMRLVDKYNTKGPRYTSYPAVPFWNSQSFSIDAWEKGVNQHYQDVYRDGISLYIHLPYCESLCTFCGCHKRITKRHSEVEAPYIKALLTEWASYAKQLTAWHPQQQKPLIREIHLGGGTPTFFSASHLALLIEGLFEHARVDSGFEGSVEGHPNNTQFEQLQRLRSLGFNRISFGVQDYDPQVQAAIHRIQPFEHVERVHEWASTLGFESISHDLVYGLPFQTQRSIEETVAKTLSLSPDRLSFYGYAHVPWIKGVGQRGFHEKDLPVGVEKFQLFEVGQVLFKKAGYLEVGFDHFAKPSDPLCIAAEGGKLHRNFMGYTTRQSTLLIGLGVSAISDNGRAFAQNEKNIPEYIVAGAK